MGKICSSSDMKIRICDMEVETCTNVKFDSGTNELKLEIGVPEVVVIYDRLRELNNSYVEIYFRGVKMVFDIICSHMSGRRPAMRFDIKPPCILHGELTVMGMVEIIDERQEDTAKTQAE